MRRRIRFRPSPAMIVACAALFVALGGTALATTYVVSSNSQVGPGTISGHAPPTGDHANVIAGSLNRSDLSNGAVTPSKLSVPAHFIGAGLPTSGCTGANPPNWNTWDGSDPTTWGPVGYYRAPNGLVHLRGVATPCYSDDATHPDADRIFSLPPGYQPAHRIYVPAVNVDTGNFDRILIFARETGTYGGEVRELGPTLNTTSLDGITFRCGPSGQNGCP